MNTPKKIIINENEYIIKEILDAIDSSLYMSILNERTRFGRFQNEDIPNKLWIKILGTDVSNGKHMRLTEKIMMKFLKTSGVELTEFEVGLMRILARSHDIQEAVTGDLPRPEKTEEHELEEIRHFQRIFIEILSPVLGPNSVILCYHLTLIMRGINEKLHELFDVVEFCGYTRTAIRAWERQNKIPVIELQDSLRKLAKEVIDNSMPKLCEYAKKYNNINDLLHTHNRSIQEIMYS